MSNYRVTVNEDFQFDFEKEIISRIDAIRTGSNEFHILHQNSSIKAEIIASDFNHKLYTVKINNTNYVVKISNALDVLIKEMGFEMSSAKQVNAIKAPMPGLILEINVLVGQKVKENDNLIILGAMKMENSFLSPRDGIIKSISVSKGDAVDKDQLLIEFE